MIRFLKYAVGSISLFITLLSFLVYDEVTTKIILTNESSADMRNVHVDVAGEDFWSGNLRPGSSNVSSHVARGEGLVVVTFDLDGQPMKSTVGWVDGSFSNSYRVRVRSDEVIVIEYVDTILRSIFGLVYR